MKEVTQGYVAPGGERRLVVVRRGVAVERFGVSVQTGRVLSEPTVDAVTTHPVRYFAGRPKEVCGDGAAVIPSGSGGRCDEQRPVRRQLRDALSQEDQYLDDHDFTIARDHRGIPCLLISLVVLTGFAGAEASEERCAL